MVFGSYNFADSITGAPQIFSYQGRLENSSGDLQTGTFYFKFSIYDSSNISGGNRLWPINAPTSTPITVSSGVFNVNIGDVANGYPTNLDYNFYDNADVFLQVDVSSNDSSFETLSPRQRIASAGFAINANKVASSTPGTGPNQILKLDDTGQISIAGNIITTGNVSFTNASTTGALTVAAGFFQNNFTNCSDNNIKKVLYNASSGVFSCGDDQSGGSGSTSLQNAYNFATSSPELLLNSAIGALTIQDTADGLHTNIFEILGQGATSTLFSVNATSSIIGVGISLQNATTTGLTVSGGSSLGSLSALNISVSNATTTGLTVSGGTSLGSLSFASATGTSLGITGGASFGSLNVTNLIADNATTTILTVSQTASTTNLYVSNNIKLGNTLNLATSSVSGHLAIRNTTASGPAAIVLLPSTNYSPASSNPLAGFTAFTTSSLTGFRTTHEIYKSTTQGIYVRLLSENDSSTLYPMVFGMLPNNAGGESNLLESFRILTNADIQIYADRQLQFGSTSAYLSGTTTSIFSNVAFGIGTTTPGQLLSVNGNGYFAGNLTVASSTSMLNASSTNLTVSGGLWQGGFTTNCTGSAQKVIYNTVTGKFDCGTDQSTSGAGIAIVQEGGVAATTTADTLNFAAIDFNVATSSQNTASIFIDYTNSKITRSTTTESIIGAWTLSNITNATVTQAFAVTQNSVLSGTLNVTGLSTLGNISTGNATTTGLTVSGGSSLGSLSALNISVSNATTTGLTVQGGTSLGSLRAGAATTTSLSVTGGTRLGSLNVAGLSALGNFTSGNATTTSLSVTGGARFGALNIGTGFVVDSDGLITTQSVGSSSITFNSIKPVHTAGQFLVAGSNITIASTSESWTISSTGGSGTTVSFQNAYNGATSSPELLLNSTVGALTIQDTALGLHTNIFEILGQGATSTLFSVNATSTAIGINAAFSVNNAAGANSLFIDSTGNIGISSTSPSAVLSVNVSNATGVTPAFNITSATSSLLFVRSDGFIGIATTSISMFTTPYATTTSVLAVSGNVVISNGGLNLPSLTSTTTIAGGFDVGSRTFTVEPFSGLTSIVNSETGSTNFESDAGVVNWVNLPVTSASATNTVQSYSAMMNGTSTLTIYALSNGTGGVTNIGVGIGTTTPTQMLTISTANATSSVAITNGWLCIDTDGGCAGSAAGTIYARYADVTGGSDIAERYNSSVPLESGDIVAASGGIEIDLATTTSKTIIGIVSSNPGMILGSNENSATSSYPIALVGRVPTKVSLENGPIAIGDRISASSVAGVGKKASSTEATVGIALEPFDGTSPGMIPEGVGKILVFVNLGQPQLAASGGTGNLAEMTTDTTSLSSDLNMNGFSLLNVKSILGLNGLWRIDEGGNITAQSVETQKLTIGGGAASGVTIYDRETTAPKCIYIEGGVIKTSDGACGATQNTGAAAAIQPASASATIPGINQQVIDSGNQSNPVATSSIPGISAPEVATTTLEILPTPTTTPEILIPASEPINTATSTP